LTIANAFTSHRLKLCVWFLWLGLVAAYAARYFRWEVDYFSSPGPIFRTLLLAALPVLIAAGPVYAWLRNERLRRYEFTALAALCVVFALIYQPLATLFVVLLFFACLAAGLRFARSVHVILATPIEMVTLGFAFGCALLIPLLFVLGLLHLYYAPLFLLLLVAATGVFWRDALAGIGALRAILATSAPQHRLAGIAFVFAVIAAVAALAVALSPSIAFDPLTDHLANARYYAAQHALEPLPTQQNSYYPQACETIMAMAWSIGGQPAAQLIPPLFFVLSLFVVFLIARSCGLNSATAFTGIVVAAMMPFVHWTGANAKDDCAMVFFEAAALLVFIHWLETRNRAWIFLGALLLGSSFAVKHVALFGAVPLICFFLYACRRIRPALVFCAILAASALYWHARTAYLTGNPVYPASLHQSVNRRPSRHPGPGRLARFIPRFRAPIRNSFAFESPLPNPTGIALLTFLPFAILLAGPRLPSRRACLIFCGVYLAYWLAMAPMVRYAILPLSLVVVLLVGKASAFFDGPESGRLVRVSIAGSLVGVLLFALLGIAIIEINAPMLALYARRIGPRQYLDQALSSHRSVAWLAAAHPQATICGNNCARAYASDPAKLYCSLSVEQAISPVSGCEYMILPSKDKPGGDAAQVYNDAFFTVWQLR
jgi:hypothetical protein